MFLAVWEGFWLHGFSVLGIRCCLFGFLAAAILGFGDAELTHLLHHHLWILKFTCGINPFFTSSSLSFETYMLFKPFFNIIIFGF
jgi:hypothetical protein